MPSTLTEQRENMAAASSEPNGLLDGDEGSTTSDETGSGCAPSSPKSPDLIPLSRPPSVGASEDDGVRSRTATMLAMEADYSCDDYLGRRRDGDDDGRGDKGSIDPPCRAAVCRWMMEAVECAGLDRETAIVAISYLDRHLASPHTKCLADRKQYQRAAMSCLYVAIKINESNTEVDAARLSGLSRGLQSPEDILECESEVIKSLGWKMSGPTAGQFVDCILNLLPSADSSSPAGLTSNKSVGDSVTSRLREDSNRQIELSIIEDHSFVPLRRSSIAVAAVLNSLKGISQDDLPLRERLEFVSRISSAFNVDVQSGSMGKIRRRMNEVSAGNVLCDMARLGGRGTAAASSSASKATAVPVTPDRKGVQGREERIVTMEEV